MRVTCKKSEFCGEFKPPVSKSEAARVIACALLSDSPTRIEVLPSSDDAYAALSCAKSLGATYSDGLFVPPSEFPKSAILNCGESATCLRFFACITAAIGGEFTLIAEKSLLNRPMDDLAKSLASGGVTLKKTDGGWHVFGKLRAGKYYIGGSVSSQYLSGLLIALPILGEDSVVVCKNLASKSYVYETARVMKKFSGRVIVRKPDDETDEYTVFGGKYSAKEPVSLALDWSGAAFFLAAGALGGKVTALGLTENMPDSQIADVLALAGAKVEKTAKSDGRADITASGGELKPFSFDFTDCPDLVPVCAVLAACINGESEIKSVARLKTKESDRVRSVGELVRVLGAEAAFDGENLLVRGGKISGGEVKTYGDHRIAMAASIAAAASSEPIIIDDAECVKKSYYSFWRDYAALGGIAERDLKKAEREEK